MKDIPIPIYSGKAEDFHWVGFGSGSGTNLRECAKIIPPSAIFCDRPSADLLSLDELAGVPKIVMNGYQECGSWKKSRGNDEAEAAYREKSVIFNRKIVQALDDFEQENNIKIDLIVLGGYMRLVELPLLMAFADRIINVHPADLNKLARGRRKYIGEDAVYDAVRQGEAETRSSVIMVDGGMDNGEILTQGKSVKIPDYGPNVNLRELSDAHQDRQKIESDWPALTTALQFISEGRIALGSTKKHRKKWRAVHIDGTPMPYHGLRLE
jgi:folate-dependent phosphoribosylglycinamide formyltransferase PurN